MITTDIIISVALLVYLVAWWNRGLTHRNKILSISALVALIVGGVGYVDHRWQNAVGAGVAAIFLLVLLVAKIRKKPVRQGIPWVSGPIITILIFLSFAVIYSFPVPNLPKPSGEYAVGTKSFELTDSNRLGLLAAKQDEPRRLLVRVWYPAGDVSGLSPRPYFTDKEAETTATGFGGLLGAPFLFQYIKHSITNAYENAPIWQSDSKLPVVVYSHGYSSFAGQNSVLMEELASHGYVVYSVQHTHDASPTLFPNGDVANIDPAYIAEISEIQAKDEGMSDSLKKAFAGTTLDERYEGTVDSNQDMIDSGSRLGVISPDIWLNDRIFVLNQLEHGNVPDAVKNIVKAGDFTRTGQMGMSFGGSTSGGFCMVDSRCTVAINLDGGNYHSTPFAKNIPVPFMMLYSDFSYIKTMAEGTDEALNRGHNDFSYERPETAGMRSDVYRLQVKNVQHIGVSDFTLFARNPVRGLLFGTIDPAAMLSIQNDFVLGFLDKHFLNKTNDFPKASYAKHAPFVEKNDISDISDWWLASHPEDVTERVVLETSLGEIELALYPKRAPISVNNFLAYVDGGHYDGASFYRAKNEGIFITQGGVFAEVMTQKELKMPKPEELIFSPVAHETTSTTGMLNERGTIALARLEPGTASSEFFINIQDNPPLDSGFKRPGEGLDSFGYATFGRVLRGMRVLELIQNLPRDVESLRTGEILNSPVEIHKAYRVKTN